MEGYRKSHYSLGKRRPITPNILLGLCNILNVVCFSPYEACLFKAAFSICFFASLRVSELVPNDSKSRKGLRINNVIGSLKNIKVFISQSKSLQKALGSRLQHVPTG